MHVRCAVHQAHHRREVGCLSSSGRTEAEVPDTHAGRLRSGEGTLRG